MTGRATPYSGRPIVSRHRYSATVREVAHWHQPPNKRQDVVRVIADLDYADGAMWWLEDEADGTKAGDRRTITVELAPTLPRVAV
jgi:hypothetical protein